MKAPDGTIDLIGSGLMLANNVTGLIKDLAPDAETRKANRLRRLIRVSKRRLKHRYKGANIPAYVELNFSEYTPEQKAAAVEELSN